MLNGWLWIVAALLLALAELLLPGYLFLGTAVGVGLMGLALLAGLWAGPFAWALVVTALASAAVMLVLRATLGARRGEVRIWHRDINEN